jgi:hypothetical protein
MKTKKETPILIIEAERTGARFGEVYFHFHGRVATDPAGMTLTDSEAREVRENGGVLFASSFRDQYALKSLSKIRVKNQSDEKQIQERGDHAFYAMEVGIGDTFVTLRDIAEAFPTLKAIDKRLTKMADTEGATNDVAMWLGRVARAIGAKRMAIRRTPEQVARTGERYRVVSIGDGISAIRSQIHAWAHPAEQRAIAG